MKVSKEILELELILNKKPMSFIMTEYSVSRATLIKYLKKLNLYDSVLSNRTSTKVINLDGKVFGNLTVISSEYTIDKHSKAKWLCRCSCGNEIYVNSASLTRDLTKTCGKCCKGFGHKDVSSTYVSHLKQSAIKRGIIFNISAEDIWNRFISQDKKCDLSGIDVSFIRNQDKCRLQSASVDRINSSVGYIPSNIRIVHKKINLMRGSMDDCEFLYLVKMIYNNKLDCINDLDINCLTKSIHKYDNAHYMG